MLSIKLLGANKIIKSLTSKDTIKKPLGKGTKNTTLKMEALTKKATVVDTGLLRSSIAHRFSGQSGFVGTARNYAQFVEYGTHKSNPPNKGRHMEGGSKKFGLGMFGYALTLLHKWLGTGEKDIIKDIEREFD